MATNELLHVARPKERNTQQTPAKYATTHATDVQQHSLKALSGAVLARNKPCNSHATTGERPCNNTPSLRPALVASEKDRQTGNAELDGLIATVAEHYEWPPDERRLMNETACGDLENALISFRLMARRVPFHQDASSGALIQRSDAPADGRVTCASCANLMRGRCQTAAKGLMEDTYSGYSPGRDVMRHCEHFKAKGH